MKKHPLVSAGILFAILTVAFLQVATAQEHKETIKIATKKEIGKYLTTGDGKALYSFKDDSTGKSACAGDCAEKWPIYCYKSDEIELDNGLDKKNFTFFRRTTDGQDHLTYKGMPLYRYVGDMDSGDTKGHGINGKWFVVKP